MPLSNGGRLTYAAAALLATAGCAGPPALEALVEPGPPTRTTAQSSPTQRQRATPRTRPGGSFASRPRQWPRRTAVAAGPPLAFGRALGVTLSVAEGRPQPTGARHRLTAINIVVTNRSPQRVRLHPDAIAIELDDGRRFFGSPRPSRVDRYPGPPAARARELRPTVVDIGESVSGFIYFELPDRRRRQGAHLVIELYADDGEHLGSIAVELPRMSLDGIDPIDPDSEIAMAESVAMAQPLVGARESVASDE